MTDIAALHEPFAKAPIGRIPVSGRGAIPKKIKPKQTLNNTSEGGTSRFASLSY
jgi:hypothetical protein